MPSYVITPILGLPVAIYFASILLLCVGFLAEIRKRAVTMSFLDAIRLDEIERQHPHLPSLRIIIGMVLFSIILFSLSLVVVADLPIFQVAYGWLYLAVVFTYLCAVGLLIEIKWKDARGYAFAITVGTALALLVFTGAEYSSIGQWVAVITGALLIACVELARRIFRQSWSLQLLLGVCFICLAWIPLLFLY